VTENRYVLYEGKWHLHATLLKLSGQVTLAIPLVHLTLISRRT
jgi:hypothetical protein